MGQDAIRIGSTIGGAALGTAIMPGVGTALGAGLGAGASTAGTGGSVGRSLTNAGLAGGAGYGLSALAPGLMSGGLGLMGLPAQGLMGSAPGAFTTAGGTALSQALPAGAGIKAGFAAGPGFAVEGLSKAAPGITKASSPMFNLSALQSLAPTNPYQALAMGGLLSSMLNPPPPQIQGGGAGISPGRGPQPVSNPTDFMIRRKA